MDVHNYQLVSYAFAALTALMLIGGLIFAGVTIKRNGRASALALAACAVLLVGQLVYTFGYQAISYAGSGFIAVTAIGGLLHLLGIALLLGAALLPRRSAGGSQPGWGGAPQGAPGGWGQQVAGQPGWAPQQEQGWSPQGGWGPLAPGHEGGVPQQGGPGFQPGTAPQSGPPYQQQQPQSGPPYQQPYPPQ